MTYMVTGGTGFIGSYIIRELIRNKEKAIAYDWLPNKDLLEKILTKKEMLQVEIVKGDIKDLAQLLHTAKNYGVTQIIHMAYMLTNDSAVNPSQAISVNIMGTNNIFETVRILGLEKVVWASSISVFGPSYLYKQKYLPNDAPHYPKTFYGACKSLNEHMAEQYYTQFGVDSTGIRFVSIYGPGQKGTGASATKTRELIEKPVSNIVGKVPYGDSWENWLYVEDAAKAVFQACKARNTETRVFNINGDIHSVKEAAKCVQTLITGARIELQPGELQQPFMFDASKIEQEIGFQSIWCMEEGIKQTIIALREWQNL